MCISCIFVNDYKFSMSIILKYSILCYNMLHVVEKYLLNLIIMMYIKVPHNILALIPPKLSTCNCMALQSIFLYVQGTESHWSCMNILMALV